MISSGKQVIPRPLNAVKKAILSSATFTYYDDEKTCIIQVDANNIGNGAALIQEEKVIEYHSCALTSTQQHYSNIEREAYALVNGDEHFHHYIFGKPFKVHTDHQPLVQLSIKPNAELSPRLHEPIQIYSQICERLE